MASVKTEAMNDGFLRSWAGPWWFWVTGADHRSFAGHIDRPSVEPVYS